MKKWAVKIGIRYMLAKRRAKKHPRTSALFAALFAVGLSALGVDVPDIVADDLGAAAAEAVEG